MHPSGPLSVSLCLLALAAGCSGKESEPRLTVKTTSGTIHGFINDTAPAVRQFLGIPYAEPPLGPLRFAPPEPKTSKGYIDATRFGNSCMQQFSTSPTIYTEEVPQFLINGGQSEDCLFANIWAPVKSQTRGLSSCISQVVESRVGGRTPCIRYPTNGFKGHKAISLLS